MCGVVTWPFNFVVNVKWIVSLDQIFFLHVKAKEKELCASMRALIQAHTIHWTVNLNRSPDTCINYVSTYYFVSLSQIPWNCSSACLSIQLIGSTYTCTSISWFQIVHRNLSFRLFMFLKWSHDHFKASLQCFFFLIFALCSRPCVHTYVLRERWYVSPY